MKPGRPLVVLRCGIIGSLLLPPLVCAELSVIYDSGNTRPLVPLIEVLVPDDSPVPGQILQHPDLGAADLERLLPIQTPGLTQGKAGRRSITQQFARPFFLIGSDPVSRRWLRTHHAALLRIGAVGMLVQAETVNDLRAIAKLAGGLPILPASATDIAEALGLSHYPVLIANQGIAQ